MNKVQVVSEKNGVYLVQLPDGCTPGRQEAADYFAEALAELRKMLPGSSFTFTPFDHEVGDHKGVNAWLAIAERIR